MDNNHKDTFLLYTNTNVGAVIIFFILLFVFAKWGPAINFSTTTQTKGEAFVVSGDGKVSVTPDIAKISIGIQQTGQTLKQVQSDVNKKSQTLTASLKSLGITDADIKTTSYNVYPQYDYAATVQKINGYQVSTNYEVTVKDFDRVNDVITSATNAGANDIGSVNFEVNEATKKQKLQEARDLAVKSAKEKAEGLAKSAGITLGKIINISENQTGGVVVRPMAFDKVSLEAGSAPSTPNIQPGTTDINVTVSLSYEVR